MDTVEASELNVLRLCSNLYFHFFLGLVTVALGFVTIVVRWIPRAQWVHPYLGQAWIYAFIVMVCTSLYVRNDGFRWFIYMFLMICMSGLIVGHVAIRHFQRRRDELRLQRSKLLPADEAEGGAPVSSSRAEALPRDLLVAKYVHAVAMVLSFVMVAGAGAMFIRRSKDLWNCYNIYAEDDSVRAGTCISTTAEGDLIFTKPI